MIEGELLALENLIDKAEPIFQMENRRLVELCREHPLHMVTYSRALGRLKSLEEFAEMLVDQTVSEKYKHYNQHSQKALSQRDIQIYIQSEPEYLMMKELQLRVTFIKKQVEAVVSALESMGYSLNNITKARVADAQGYTV